MELAVIALIAMFGLTGGKRSDSKSSDLKLVELLLAVVFIAVVFGQSAG